MACAPRFLFAMQYLKERFDVPDILVPALSELVASLVFRQARPLLLGYDRGPVAANDLVWRHKVSSCALKHSWSESVRLIQLSLLTRALQGKHWIASCAVEASWARGVRLVRRLMGRLSVGGAVDEGDACALGACTHLRPR